MRRRDALRSGSGLLGASLAGCLASLESESAWRDLVVDRPDRVYVPPKVDGMTTWGTETVGGYAVSLFATRPHRFWTVTGRETTQIAMREDHSVHLMASVRNPETGRHVPAEVTVSIERGGESVLDRTLWPMLSQRMGVHRGDNVALPGDGVYTAVLRVLPETRRAPEATGAGFEPATVEIEFEFEERTIDALGRTILDEDRRGRPGAVEPMDHAGHGRSGDDHGHAERGHPPVPTAPPVDSLPGIVAISEADDCRIVVALLPIDGEDGEYLAVSPRTPYNGFPLARASLSATIGRDGGTETPLYAALDPDLGNHYGRVVDPVGSGEELTIAFDSPPQLARHEGYETAFLDAPSVTLSLPP